MKNSEINGIIYGARNRSNEKWYVGQTIRGIEKRRQEHLKAARNNNCHTYRCVFHDAIRKYGEYSFEWTVLEADIHTYDELNEAEKYWIKEKNARVKDGGYNMNAGGNGTPNHQTDFVAWNKGQHLSEETKMKISAANRGRIHTEEERRHMSEAKKGKPHSEEHRMNITNTIRKRCFKPVLMYNRNGDFIAEFPSVKAAADYIGVNHRSVTMVLTGKYKTVGGGSGNKNAGYTFKYKNENPDR